MGQTSYVFSKSFLLCFLLTSVSFSSTKSLNSKTESFSGTSILISSYFVHSHVAVNPHKWLSHLYNLKDWGDKLYQLLTSERKELLSSFFLSVCPIWVVGFSVLNCWHHLPSEVNEDIGSYLMRQ